MPPHDGYLMLRAKAGDADAVEGLIDSVRDNVYRLALRMVAQPADAEDAAQEILIKVLTRLATFRGDAAFGTWVHRIAVNHLLDRKKSAVEQMEMTFEHYGEDLLTGLTNPPPMPEPEAELLAKEVRLGCTMARLTCLDRQHRVAYILGEIFQVEYVAELLKVHLSGGAQLFQKLSAIATVALWLRFFRDPEPGARQHRVEQLLTAPHRPGAMAR